MTIGNKLKVAVISSPLLWIHTGYCVPADANMHLRNITPPQGHMQPEAQLSLLSVEVTQADLRLYLAIKTSVSSSIVYVDHKFKAYRKGGNKSPSMFKILFSLQFIVILFT